MRRKNKENEEYIKRAKQEALAQWRGIDLTEEERAREKTEKQVADVVKNVFEKIKFEERRSQAEVINVWKNALDPLIVAHTQPVALKNGVLIVYVDNSVWLNEINSFWKQDILLKLQSAFGKTMIKNIYFTIG
ncbi:MAG: DUF721 domain-containing protein [Verrucomicrobiia bacterium]